MNTIRFLVSLVTICSGLVGAQPSQDYSFLYTFSAFEEGEILRVTAGSRDGFSVKGGTFSVISVPSGEQKIAVFREGEAPLEVGGLIPPERSGCLFLFSDAQGALAASFLVVEASENRAQLTTLSFIPSKTFTVNDGKKDILSVRPLTPQSATVTHGKTLSVTLADGQSEEFSISRGVHYMLVASARGGEERVTIIPIQRRKAVRPAEKPPW